MPAWRKTLSVGMGIGPLRKGETASLQVVGGWVWHMDRHEVVDVAHEQRCKWWVGVAHIQVAE